MFSPPSLPTFSRASEYTLVYGVLGSGGFGLVLSAIHPSDPPIAIKAFERDGEMRREVEVFGGAARRGGRGRGILLSPRDVWTRRR